MADVISTLALRVDSQHALQRINEFSLATENLGSATDALKGKLLQLTAGFLSYKAARSLVDAAKEGQETLGKFESVLGRFSGKAQKTVDELVANFNFDTATAQASVSGMVDTFVKAGIKLDEALDLSSSLNKRAADIEAFTNAQDGLAGVTDRITTAMLGNNMAVRSLGIVLSEDSINAQKAKEAFEGLKFSTDRAATMHARYSLILQQSASAAGQVARETDNLSNRERFLRAKVEDLKGSLGEALIPVFTKATVGLSDFVAWVNKLSPAIKNGIVATGAITGAMITFLPFISRTAIGLATLAQTRNISRAITSQQTAAVEANTSATAAETSALGVNNAALASATSASAAMTAQKNAETAARDRNIVSLMREQELANRPMQVGETFDAKTKRDAKIFWRSQQAENLAQQTFSGGFELSTKERLALKRGLKLDASGRIVGGLGGKSNAGSIALQTGALFGKTALKPIATASEYFTKLFSVVGNKIPIIGRFAGVLGTLGGTATVIGGIVGAFQVFKNLPNWLEVAFEKAPEIFANIGKKSISALQNFGSSALAWSKNLVVQGTLGFGQTVKRLAGFETEATRAYELNKKIEEANARRAKLIDEEQKQRVAESKVLKSQTDARRRISDAYTKYAVGKNSDVVTLTNATNQRDDLATRIQSQQYELSKQVGISRSSLSSQDQRDAAVEQANALSTEIEQLTDEWLKASQEVDKLSETLAQTRRSFEDSQRSYARTLETNARNLADYQRQAALASATTRNDRTRLLQTDADAKQAALNESIDAEKTASEKNAQIETIQKQLVDESVGKALSALQKLAESGDTSGDSHAWFASAVNQLEKAGYEVGDQMFGEGAARRLLGQINDRRIEQQRNLDTLTSERDEAAQIAGERASRQSALDDANRAITESNNAFEQDQKTREFEQTERQNAVAREQERKIRDRQDKMFSRQLEDVDRYYGDDAFGASQAKYSLTYQRLSDEWSKYQENLDAQSKQIESLNAQITALDNLDKAGMLDAEGAKKRAELTERRNKLQDQYESDQSDAESRFTNGNDSLLNYQNAMLNAFESSARKYADEQSNALRERLNAQEQEANALYQKRLQERESYMQEQRQAVSGQRSVAAGTSEAFGISSRIWERGQAEDRPEQRIAKTTEQIEARVEEMKQAILDMVRMQGNYTLSLGY